MTKRLVIRLPDSLYESLQEAAEEEKMLPAELIREMLRGGFEAETDEPAEDDEGEDEDDKT